MLADLVEQFVTLQNHQSHSLSYLSRCALTLGWNSGTQRASAGALVQRPNNVAGPET